MTETTGLSTDEIGSIDQFYHEYCTFSPSNSAIRSEFVVAVRDVPDLDERLTRMRSILDKHGYGHLRANDYYKVLNFVENESQITSSEHIPKTKVVPQKTASFRTALWADVYLVTSDDAPVLQIAIKVASDGLSGEVEFVNTNHTFKANLEQDVQTGNYYLSWTDTQENVYKIGLFTTWQPEDKKIVKQFSGSIQRAGVSLNAVWKFDGKAQDLGLQGGDWFDRYGPYCIVVGPFLLYNLVSLCFDAAAKEKKPTKDESEIRKAGGEQSTQTLSELKAMGEAAVAEKFLENTSGARRDQLLDQIKDSLRTEYGEWFQKLPSKDKEGEVKPDPALEAKFNKIIRDKITDWVRANPNIPGNPALIEMTKQKLYSETDLSLRDARIRAEATAKVKILMSETGEYHDMITHIIDQIRFQHAEWYAEERVAEGRRDTETLADEHKSLLEKIADLTHEANAKVEEQTRLKRDEANNKERLEEVEKELEQLDTDIKREEDNQKEVEKKQKEAEGKIDNGTTEKHEAEEKRQEAERKSKEREEHFKQHHDFHGVHG